MKFFRPVFLLLILAFVALVLPQKSSAASLTNAKDTVTTSRPSPSSPLSADAASSVSQLSIYNNGSRYLASDSAQIIRNDGSIIVNGKIVASQSAALTTVYLTTTTGTAAQNGTDVLISPITAMHTIQFTATTAIPASGKIVIGFPGGADTSASPSATAFAMNGLTTGIAAANISYKLDGTRTCSFTVASPNITCTVDSGGAIAAGTTITFLIGCADASTNETTCTTQSPRFINPTKAAAAGTNDRWKINVTTQDASSNNLDTATVAVGIIESVQVLATVDPSLTFTIAGVSNGSAINNGNTTGCTNTETTNAGVDATSTVVNLGVLGTTPTTTDTKISNIAAQLLTVSTNAASGYSLTATTSGNFRNASTGFDISSSTTPAAFPNGAPWFGIHPCGLNVSAATWTSSGANQNCNTYITGSTGNICKYGWPSSTSPTTLASKNSGPIANSLVTGDGIVSVEYASGIDGSVPAGNYQSVITYVATPAF